jgi:uncharacterized protein
VPDQPTKPKRQPNSGSFKPGESGRSRARKRTDAWTNPISGHGTARQALSHTYYALDIVRDDEARHLWRTEWLAAKVIETLPSEAFRRGYDIEIESKAKSEQLSALASDVAVNAETSGRGVDFAIVTAIEYARAYGGGAILPIMDGALGDMSEPLDPDRIGEVLALHVLEPRELMIAKRYVDNPRKLGQPELYRLVPLSGYGGHSQLIHESRLCVFPGLRVSKQIQPGQRDGWGDSELCRPIQLIRNLGLSLSSAATLLNNYGREILRIQGWAELAAQSGGDQLMAQRLARMDAANSAVSTLVLDKEDEIAARSATSLSGVDKLIETQAHFVAAACGIPVSVLLDMSPGSLNATGDMNIRNWYSIVEAERESNYKPQLEQVLSWLMPWDEPDEWGVKFRPLWTPSEAEQEQTRKTTAERDKLYFDMGVVSADDIATSRFGGDTYSAETTIDWAARKAQQAIDAERAEAMDKAALEALGRGQPSDDDEGDDEPQP